MIGTMCMFMGAWFVSGLVLAFVLGPYLARRNGDE